MIIHIVALFLDGGQLEKCEKIRIKKLRRKLLKN
jgi:hypothetical protein